MKDLQYGTKQYAIKQYGKYKRIDKESDKTTYSLKGNIRIKSISTDGNTSEWIKESSPLFVHGLYNKFRIKTNEDSYVYSKSINLKGKHTKIRLTQGEQSIVSQIE